MSPAARLLRACIPAVMAALMAGGARASAAEPRPDDVVGLLYVNNNGSANSVRAFRIQRDGRLVSIAGSPFPTQGVAGTAGFITFPSARPTLARQGPWLYATNISDNTVSGFRIAADGSLSPLTGSPFSIGAPTPFSRVEGLAAHPGRPLLYAADTSGGVTTMEITPGGGLVHSGLDPHFVGERPEDLAVSPDGTLLAVSSGVTTGRLHIFQIGASGELSPAPGSPIPLEGSQFGGGLTFSAGGDRLFVASETLGAGRIHVYDVLEAGALRQAPGSPFLLERLEFPDDLILSPDGRFLFVADPFTQGITTLAVAQDGSLAQVAAFVPHPAADEPSGLALSLDGSVLFTANFSDRSIGVLQVDAGGGLSPMPHSPVLEAGDDGLIDGGILVLPADLDGDGLSLERDNCPLVSNDLQQDQDGDGTGDVCDVCVARFDPGQADADGDGLGDRCDPDGDDDGVPTGQDNCPLDANPGQEDADADGRGDACDNCPDAANPSQVDRDADGAGDACADRHEGFLYVNTNGRFNSVAAFRVSRDGRLEPLPGSPFLTGGGGTLGTSLRQLFPGAVLARGARYLYATNADTRSVSGFAVRDDGTLERLLGSPFNLGSLSPSAMAVHPSLAMLYVGFAEAFGLHATRIGADGSLSPAPGFVPCPGLPIDLAVSPDGRFLVVSASLGTFYQVVVFRVDPATGEPALQPGPRFTLPISSFPSSLAFDPASGLLYLSDENVVHVLSLDAQGSVAPIPGSPFRSRGGGGSVLAHAPDGTLIFVSDGAGNGVSSLRRELSPGRPGAFVTAGSPYPNAGGSEPSGLAVDRTGRHLFVSNTGADVISIFDVDREGTLRRNRHSPSPIGVAGSHARGRMAFLPADPEGDGRGFGEDVCPFDHDPPQQDGDGDGSGDACDRCPGLPDTGHDLDHDGAGDACDPDRDGDGVPDSADGCVTVPDPAQSDFDGDGSGDACDPCLLNPAPDDDGDGLCGVTDNCPSNANAAQDDEDEDGAGDLCDEDADGDGLASAGDNCPLDVNPLQEDRDGDGAGDRCDNCLHHPNAGQEDADGDGAGDRCEHLPAGILYVNNDSAPANSVSAFLVSQGGAMRPLPGSPYRTGSTSNPGRRAAPRLAIDARRQRLFALNDIQGRAVAVFDILPDGRLQPIDGSPFQVTACGSGDAIDISPDGRLLALAQGEGECLALLVVAEDGTLSNPIGSSVTVSQLIEGLDFSPDGRFVAVTHPLISSIGMYVVGPGATLTAAPGSPFRANPSRDFGVSGVVFSAAGDLLWTGGGRSSPPSGASAFTVLPSGALEEQRSSPSQGRGTGPSAVGVTPDARFLVASNEGSNNIDVYRLRPTGLPISSGVFQNLTGALGAAGLAVNRNSDRLFMTNIVTGDVSAWHLSRRGRLTRLADLPVPTGQPNARPGGGLLLHEGDPDGDGLDFGPDDCPAVYNPGQGDTDGDDHGDPCDNCPSRPNRDQTDTDGDLQGDVCDTDDDADGIGDAQDNCPLLAVEGQGDQDADGTGDACDQDRDGDGFPDVSDICPTVPDTGQADLDHDGVGDACEGRIAGLLYLPTNAPANSVAGFAVSRAGTLGPLPGSPWPTRGMGSDQTRPSMPAIALIGDLLLTANAGTGDVSVQRIGADGALSHVLGSPAPAPGLAADGVAVDPARRNVFTVGHGRSALGLMRVDQGGSLSGLGEIALLEEPDGMAFDAARGLLAVSMEDRNRIDLFASHVQAGAARAPGSPFAGDSGGTPRPLAFVPGGGRLIVGNAQDASGRAGVYEVTGTPALVRIPASPFTTGLPGIAALSLSPGGGTLAAMPADPASMGLLGVAPDGTLGVARRFQGRPGAQGPGASIFSPDGSLLFVANASNDVSVFRVGGGLSATPLGPGPVPTGDPGGRPAGGIVFVTADVDGDGQDFSTDNCPFQTNVHQEDLDGDGAGDPCDGRVPPLADAGADRIAECSPAGPGAGTRVVLDGRSSRDPDDTSGSGGIVSFEWYLDPGGPGEKLLGEEELIETLLPPGAHRIVLRVRDADGQTGDDTTLVTIEDTRPPELSIDAAPAILRPPDHQLVPVSVRLAARDACGEVGRIELESIVSSQPDDAPGAGDGHTSGDVAGVEPGTPDTLVHLRAERDPRGGDRLYTLTYRVVDGSGNVGRGSVVVTVPRAR